MRAACADTHTNFGGFIAIQNLLSGRGRPPAIISIRDLESESYPGSSFNAYINQLYQLAVLQGVTISRRRLMRAQTHPTVATRKPLFQYLVDGNPSDGVRDVPDVSLFAGNGVWGHSYVICYSDPTPGFFGAPCVGAPDGWSGGRTSFASPILAGIQAMINQTTQPHQGNPDFVYYALAGLEYGFKGKSSCNSTLGNQSNPNCIF